LRRLVALLGVVALGSLACRQIAGISTITYLDAGDAGDGAPVCSSGTPLFTSASTYDLVYAQGGFAYFDVGAAGVGRCPSTGCPNAQTLVSSTNYTSFALGSSLIYYTLQNMTADGGSTGSLRNVGLDGGGDTQMLGNLAYPFWVATTGTRIFWADDPVTVTFAGQATIHCVGCTGPGDVPWITQLGETYALIADTNTVYVLVDDNTNTQTSEVVACSTQTACAASPRKVIGGLTQVVVPVSPYYPDDANMASDGTYLYLIRSDKNDIVRVDGTGTVLTLVTGVLASAIAIDAPSGNLYYGTDSTIFHIKSDGTGASTAVVCNQAGLSALAVDSQNVYFLTSNGTANNAPFWAPK
jgi:hypothetical protein